MSRFETLIDRLLVAAIAAVSVFAPAIVAAGVNSPPPMFPSAVSGNVAAATFPLPPLSGPCDILAAAGTPCVAAHSVTRALFGAYTGALFQLTRASDSMTQAVGVTTGGLYNAATVASFCAGTACYITDIYDQTGNANNLPQAIVASAAPWLIHPANGLPVVVTTQNAAFYRNRPGNGGATTNLPTGAAAAATYYVRATDVYGSCCGEYGRMENNTGVVTAGAMWALGYDLCTAASPTCNSFLGLGVDTESNTASAQLGATPAIVGYLSKYNQTTGLYTDEYWDAAKGIVSTLATKAPYTTLPTVQSGISLGEGGDGSTAPTEFFEGAVISGATSQATDAAIAANVASFYGPAAANVTLGPVDAVINSGICAGALCTNHAKRDFLGAIGGAWGLRKLRFSYTGYAANIRRASDNTTTDIGFTAIGDFDDAAALAFCAGTTCFIDRLYNQALSPLNNNTNGTVYDMVQATTAKQPQLIFNDINGRTAMRSNGSQYMCNAQTITTVGPSWAMNAVAERTGNTSAVTNIINANGGTSGASIGWAASTNTAELNPGASGNIPTATAADNAWHSIIGQINVTSTNGDTSLQVDNGTPSTNAGNAGYSYDTIFNALFSSSFVGPNCGTANDVMTGDIAEAMILAIGGSAVNYTGHLSAAQIAAIYNSQHIYYGGKF